MCVSYLEWLKTHLNNSSSDDFSATIGHEKCFSFFKMWKTGKMHCGILNKFYSFSHQIILSSYCVPVRDVIILSIKQHYRGTTTTNFVSLIEWVHWFGGKIETTWQQVFNSFSFNEQALKLPITILRNVQFFATSILFYIYFRKYIHTYGHSNLD